MFAQQIAQNTLALMSCSCSRLALSKLGSVIKINGLYDAMVGSVDKNAESIVRNNANPQALGHGENSRNETNGGNGYFFWKKLRNVVRSKYADICWKVRWLSAWVSSKLRAQRTTKSSQHAYKLNSLNSMLQKYQPGDSVRVWKLCKNTLRRLVWFSRDRSVARLTI